MKTCFRGFVLSLTLAFAVFATAKDVGYETKINSLFGRSASCLIEGDYSMGDVFCMVNHIANSEKKLASIKKCFLDVNAKYFGLDNFDRPPSMHSCFLALTWKDANNKVVGTMYLVDGNMLIFSDRDIYKVDNITLLMNIVIVTNPEAFKTKPRANQKP